MTKAATNLQAEIVGCAKDLSHSDADLGAFIREKASDESISNADLGAVIRAIVNPFAA